MNFETRERDCTWEESISPIGRVAIVERIISSNNVTSIQVQVECGH